LDASLLHWGLAGKKILPTSSSMIERIEKA
jgi:hypothetical protein